MATPSRLEGDFYCNGNFGCKTFTPPAASVGASAISGVLPASSLEGEFDLTVDQTGTVVAATRYLRVARGATATVVALQAAITETIATGADRTVTIDLQKSTGAGAFATILTATLVLNNASTLRQWVAASIASAGLVTGDILKLTVAVAGAAGAQAAGLVVSVTIREQPN